jgi:signal transduction histidine kinase/ActR/RegA family two-component response regulator
MLIVTAGVFSYNSYNIYVQENKTHKSLHLSTFLDKLIYLLEKVDNERVNSNTYLATHSKSKFEQVLKAREEVDNTLLNFSQYLKENPSLSAYYKYLKETNIALNKVREEVDNPNDEILFASYHSRVFVPLLNILTEFSLNTHSKTEKSNVLILKKIISLKENTQLENMLISMVLLQQRALSDKEKILWNQIIQKDKLPNFNTLHDKELAADLHTLFLTNEYNNILQKDREQILQDSSSAEYKTNIVEWLNKIIIKMKYYNKAESIVTNNIKKIDEINASKANYGLMIAYALAALALLSLILLFKLIFMRSKLINNKKIYEDTHKNIELVFDKEQQKKIKRLIENGQVDLIYKFLIKAIGDANQTKDLFLASMSHEIRTPLNGILGFTQLLKETSMTEEQNEFLTVVQKSSEHLLSIVNDILDLSKIKAQKIELENIDFDPIESFEATIESYAAKATEKNIEFNSFFDPTLPTLLVGDPTKISQVIVNLISNAIKFTSNNGDIDVAIEKLNENNKEVEVKFSVSDSGIGVTKEQQKNIFEAFSQADVSTSRKYGGTGLGLSISGKLIDLMGGKLQIKSVKDEGSTFYFTLTFKKAKGATRRVVEDMSSYTVGILDPHIEEKYYINKNLEAYINYTGAKIKHYTDESLLSIGSKSELPDILFVDHKFRYRGGELENFLNIECKIVVMTTGDQKRNLMRYKSSIDKILYKPVNFSKTLKALSNKEDSSENIEQINFKDIHVLVAEDNSINQKLIINVLNAIGVEVSIANNGQEAVEQRMQNNYDMIFMDIEMPIMGGMEATVKILSYERHNGKKHIPIIALTANALSGDKEKYMGAGMDGYLSKPIELNTLRDIFREYFEDKIVESV